MQYLQAIAIFKNLSKNAAQICTGFFLSFAPFHFFTLSSTKYYETRKHYDIQSSE